MHKINGFRTEIKKYTCFHGNIIHTLVYRVISFDALVFLVFAHTCIFFISSGDGVDTW